MSWRQPTSDKGLRLNGGYVDPLFILKPKILIRMTFLLKFSIFGKFENDFIDDTDKHGRYSQNLLR